MNAKQQYGQGLSGFMMGLLLATVIIGAVVYWLNRGSSNDFKEPTVQKELPVPEILTPKQELASSVPTPTETPASPEVLPEDIEMTASSPASEAKPTVAQPTTPVVVPPVSTPPKAQFNEPKPSTPKPPVVVKTQPKAETPKAEPKPKTAKAPKEEKPSPEQILESGNVEKAREQARREAIAKEQERKKAEAALSGKAEKSSRQGESKTVVQAGAYGNRDAAESQRAKLAMMGVNANIVQAEVKGQTMYRVQTAPSSKESAAETRKTLQQNGVDSFERSE